MPVEVELWQWTARRSDGEPADDRRRADATLVLLELVANVLLLAPLESHISTPSLFQETLTPFC